MTSVGKGGVTRSSEGRPVEVGVDRNWSVAATDEFNVDIQRFEFVTKRRDLDLIVEKQFWRPLGDGPH